MAADVVEDEALARKRERLFPEGWFQAACSGELAVGEVKRLKYFGQELVLFRSESGRAQMLSAYWAHLGAHLGVGGKVVGERIACPFHAWEYGVDGKCGHIPYNDTIPARGAEVRSWPTEEACGIIFFWHSPFGRGPQWPLPRLAEYGQPGWGDYYLQEQFELRSTLQDMTENVADAAHAIYVHGSPEMPPVTFAFDGAKFRATFENDLPTVGGKVTNSVVAHGLGIIEGHGLGYGEKAFFSCGTPIDENIVRLWFSILVRETSEHDPTGEISKHSARATILEYQKDVPIWEAKMYRHVPLLVKDDGPIGKYRVWAGQFFRKQKSEKTEQMPMVDA